MADNVPNIAEELHLELVKKEAVYEEYCFDCSSYSDVIEPICLQRYIVLYSD